MKKCKLKKIAKVLTAVLLAVSVSRPVMCAQDLDELVLTEESAVENREMTGNDDGFFSSEENVKGSDARVAETSDVPEYVIGAQDEEKFNNVNAQDYSRCSQIIRSYMIDNGNGFLVGRAYSDSIKIDTYSYNLKKTGNTRTIKCELPKFGGFFRDSAGNYYICSGKDNSNSSDTAEVFRVTKYDSSFNKMGSVSVKGMNTYEIFRAATLRMAEKNGVLYVRSGHTMYDDGDGLHHQACFTLQIDTESMELIDGHWDVANIGSGYACHSFDQYIMIDDSDNVVAMDLGDAYPRALVMGRYYTKAGREKLIGNKWYVYENVHVMDIYGTIGNNYTGVAAGGLEYSDKKYLAAFSSIEQEGSLSSGGN